MTLPTATVVISTKNRKDDLRRALASCLRQTASPDVLVIDDGSTDGTAEMVRQEFPSVRFVRDEVSRGYIVQRNRGAGLAASEIIVSIDDDAEFVSPETVAQTLAEFDDSRVAALAIPFINVNYSSAVKQRAPRAEGTFITDSFTGTSHALRRKAFLDVGGYRESLFHQGEEEDLCIRLLDAGYFTRLGNADPIHHYESPARDRRRMDVFGARNKILFCWYNVPLPYLALHLPAAVINRLIFGFRSRRPLRAIQGLMKGLFAGASSWRERRPVRAATYKLFRSLRDAGCLPIEAVQQNRVLERV